MNAKRIVIIFLSVFVIAVGIGITIRMSKAPNIPADTDIKDPVTTQEAPISVAPAVSEETIASVQSEPIVSEPEPDPSEDPEPNEPNEPEFEPEEPISEPEPEPEPEEPGEVRLCIGGDTSIDSEFADAAKRWGVDYPWKEVREVFSSADIAIVNLETCVSDRGESEKREGFGFRMPPEMLEGFVNAGIDMVCLANNHTRDFGYDALVDTFSHLTDNGIEYFGAGEDIDRAAGLVIREENGVKVGFTAANYVSLKADCAAAEDHAGINMIYKMNDERTSAYLDKIKEYDEQCDVLIVFMHCGIEETFEINTYQKELSRALIDSGADIVVGAHPHTLQPIEFYNGKPIIYSIGNLIFWHVDDDIDGLTAIFDITVDKNGFKSLKLHPLFIKNYKVYYLEDGSGKFPSRYSQIIELMNKLCNKYGIAFDDEGNMVEYGEQSEPEA